MRDDHCHIIWGVDDGSPDWETTCKMVEGVRACGFNEVICTPHMRWSDFDNAKVVRHFNELSAEALSRHGISMWLGYEVYYKTLLRQGLDTARNYVTAGTSNLLLEFNSGEAIPEGWEHAFYKLQTTYGLDLTIAHPERYTSVLADFSIVHKMKDMGCRIQVSAGDLFGGLFNAGAKCAKRIIDEGLCDALVSDAHCPGHYRDFERALKRL